MNDTGWKSQVEIGLLSCHRISSVLKRISSVDAVIVGPLASSYSGTLLVVVGLVVVVVRKQGPRPEIAVIKV